MGIPCLSPEKSVCRSRSNSYHHLGSPTERKKMNNNNKILQDATDVTQIDNMLVKCKKFDDSMECAGYSLSVPFGPLSFPLCSEPSRASSSFSLCSVYLEADADFYGITATFSCILVSTWIWSMGGIRRVQSEESQGIYSPGSCPSGPHLVIGCISHQLST